MLRTVRLYGELGAKYGRVHRLAVGSASAAVRALCILIPGFEKEFKTAYERGVGYAVFLGKKNIGRDELQQQTNEDIRIAPMIQGSKRGGLFQILAGALIVGASLLTFNAAGMAASATGLLGMTGGYAVAGNIGLAIALGGLAQVISPAQKSLSTKDNVNNGASYNFNGPINTTAQGNPVQLVYGEIIVGSAVASSGIYAEDQA